MDEKAEAKEVAPRQTGRGGPLDSRRPEIEYFEGASDPLHDPRTEEDWFKGLDAITRSDFKREWTVSRQIAQNRKRIRKDSASRAWKEGLVLFFIANTFFAPIWMSWQRTLFAVILGPLVGRLWYHYSAGRYRAILIGLPFHLLIQISMVGLPQGGDSMQTAVDGAHLFLCPLGFAMLAGLCGASREFQKADASEI